MWLLLRQLAILEDGQDLIEYALLTATIGIAGAATWPAIANSLGQTYQFFNTDTQDIWQPLDPGGGGGS